MSFFDEAEEPRTAPRSAPRRTRSSGGGRRPPRDQQAILMRRRLIALGALLVLLIFVVFGVSSCENSARRSALRDYNSNVVAIAQQSDGTGRQVFGVLSGGGNPHAVQTSLNQARDTADGQLAHARGFSVPDEVRTAQQNLLLALKMRRDGIANVASNIQPALSGATSRDAVTAIAAEMARLYASDVLYKDYTVPFVLGALRSAGIQIGGANGQPVEAGQFVPDLRWLQPAFVTSQLHATGSATQTKAATPGTHGHTLASVSVAGTTLQTGSTNTITASPPPTFTFSFSNTGQNNETNVMCKVTVSGAGVSGQTTVAQTTAGQSTTCNVPLDSAPPTGTYTLQATVSPVAGETNTTNNTLSFPVTFQ